MSSRRAALALALTFGPVESMAEEPRAEGNAETMESPQLFYRGDLDDQVITANNGARVNGAYASFVSEGPWAEVKAWEITPRIHTITGYGIANHTFVEGETGLIMIDTGQSLGAGLEALNMKQTFSNKPVVAIIYSHHHYTRGTRAVVESHPEIDMPIFGHPDVDENMKALSSYLAPGRFRRGFIQFGRYLPTEGVDALFGITEPEFEDPSLNAGGHLPVTRPVTDGEQVVVDGISVVFYHAAADTEDSLIVHFPELDAVVHNTAVMPFMFPMYTLRGDYHRSPPEVLASIDKVRSLKPKYLIGCHGFPVVGRERAYEFATAHRDALAFVYQQTVRGINRGLHPNEIAHELRLPPQLVKIPQLYPAYVDVEHMVRGIYGGLVGWFANDVVELHPPLPAELGVEIVRGFGGADALLERAEQVLGEKRYNLAAKLAAYALADDPGNQNARQTKAAALRRMAQATPTGMQTRNFLLYEALLLEGKITMPTPVAHGRLPLPLDTVSALPPASTLEALSYTIDGERAADLVARIRIDITDDATDAIESFTLTIRHGATEFAESGPEGHDLNLAFNTQAWAELLLGRRSLRELVDEGRAEFTGDEGLKAEFLDAYHEVM